MLAHIFKKSKRHFIYIGKMQSYILVIYILGDFAASEKTTQEVNRFKRCAGYLN